MRLRSRESASLRRRASPPILASDRCDAGNLTGNLSKIPRGVCIGDLLEVIEKREFSPRPEGRRQFPVKQGISSEFFLPHLRSKWREVDDAAKPRQTVGAQRRVCPHRLALCARHLPPFADANGGGNCIFDFL